MFLVALRKTQQLVIYTVKPERKLKKKKIKKEECKNVAVGNQFDNKNPRQKLHICMKKLFYFLIKIIIKQDVSIVVQRSLSTKKL